MFRDMPDRLMLIRLRISVSMSLKNKWYPFIRSRKRGKVQGDIVLFPNTKEECALCQ